jgi:hypothetical protein
VPFNGTWRTNDRYLAGGWKTIRVLGLTTQTTHTGSPVTSFPLPSYHSLFISKMSIIQKQNSWQTHVKTAARSNVIVSTLLKGYQITQRHVTTTLNRKGTKCAFHSSLQNLFETVFYAINHFTIYGRNVRINPMHVFKSSPPYVYPLRQKLECVDRF